MADIWYMEVMPVQEPQDMQQNPPGAAQVVFNVMARKKPSDTFEEELVQILVDAAVGQENVDIFASSNAVIPSTQGTYLTVHHSGGPAGERTQNVRGISYPRPTALITVQAPDYRTARAMAFAAHRAFAAIRNQFVTIP